jgi:hypothetical protein
VSETTETAPVSAESTDTISHAAERLLKEPSPEVTPKEEPETVAEAVESPEEEAVTEDPVEEVQEESEVQTEVEEPESEEEEPPEQYYAVKIDGEEMEVTLDELQSGYQRQKDYTKKTQSLAEQRNSYEGKTAELDQLHQAFTHQATLANELLNRDLKKFESVDWETLKVTDPNDYVVKQIEVQDIRTKQQELQAHAQQAFEHNRQVQNQADAQELEVQRKEALKIFPEWKNADKAREGQQELLDYGASIGYTPEDLAKLVKARDIELLSKAMQFDRLKTTKGAIAKKKVAPAIRKTIKKKGLAPKGVNRQKAVQDKRGQLRKSGSLKDAAALMVEMSSSKQTLKPKG